MFRIAVCDDNKTDTKMISELLNEYSLAYPDIDITTCCFNKASELIKNINKGESFDLFILDIVMPETDGIKLAKEIRKENVNTPLIFLTLSTDYAFDAFGVSAIQYLLKPIAKNKLFTTLDAIINMNKNKPDDYFLVAAYKSKVKLKFSSIVYIESANRSLNIHLNNKKIIQSLKIRLPFVESVAPLLNDNRFLYAHTSYLLNMDYVEKLVGNMFVMVGGMEIPVPRYKFAKAKNEYINYLSERGVSILGGKTKF